LGSPFPPVAFTVVEANVPVDRPFGNEDAPPNCSPVTTVMVDAPGPAAYEIVAWSVWAERMVLYPVLAGDCEAAAYTTLLK
jgi:hypothetical protein